MELSQGRHTFRWWSEDSKSWDGPHETPVVGIVPDKLEDLGESGHGMRGPEVRRLRGQYPPASGQESTVREVDYDSSFTPDTGYSGWVRLSDGRIFCVNYIIDDWPTAQIRGYWLDESFLA
ncbi:MAG TPA: hypothetical protein EYP17_06020 [Candidatus Latescibacteria bacterium]|nr:hypothetical protein [Candidatus Latescibacterota bacterium]